VQFGLQDLVDRLVGEHIRHAGDDRDLHLGAGLGAALSDILDALKEDQADRYGSTHG
jgi:hypothetical protein